MKSCLNCNSLQETLFDDMVECGNEKSVYYGRLVDDRYLCREWEENER